METLGTTRCSTAHRRDASGHGGSQDFAAPERSRSHSFVVLDLHMSAVTESGYAAKSCWNVGGDMSPKQVCLERLREQCSLCGEWGDIQIKLKSSCKFICSTCTFRETKKHKELEAFDAEVARRINNLEVASRRRFLRPLLEAGCLREMLACPPACPKLVFSTRVRPKQKCHSHLIHVSFNEQVLQIILLQTTTGRRPRCGDTIWSC